MTRKVIHPRLCMHKDTNGDMCMNNAAWFLIPKEHNPLLTANTPRRHYARYACGRHMHGIMSETAAKYGPLELYRIIDGKVQYKATNPE